MRSPAHGCAVATSVLRRRPVVESPLPLALSAHYAWPGNPSIGGTGSNMNSRLASLALGGQSSRRTTSIMAASLTGIGARPDSLEFDRNDAVRE